MTPATLNAVGGLLAQHLGLEVGSIGAPSIAAAITARAHARNVDPADYPGLPAYDPAELAALVDEIVVPESWFFRDRIPFTHLASVATERLRTSKNRRFRVLSAPCATGEEPYSVVMALRDAGLTPDDFSVDAVDVSPPLIAAAQRGEFRPVSFRGADLAYRDRYFFRAGEATAPNWKLVEEIRTAVQFRVCNLTARDALAGERPYDAILCRNLLIYLTADARKALLARLSDLLVDGGVLIMGHAEALEVIDPRFKAVPVSGSFAYMMRDKNDQPTGRMQARGLTKTQPVSIAPPPQRPTAAMPPLDKPAPDRKIVLAEAQRLADRGDLARAADVVQTFLSTAGADANAWSLLGTIKQAGGDLVRAEECYSRALYCDPGLYHALVHLALLLDKRGETAGAANLRRRAERAKTRSVP